MNPELTLVIDTSGNGHCLYGETLNLASLGSLQIERASHVEPDEHGRWTVDLSPVGGPTIGPYATRSFALSVETEWLIRQRLLTVGTLATSTPEADREVL